MSINHNVDLNLSASIMPPVLSMAQYDANSRTIVATLWDGTSGFNIPSGAVVMVRFGKPDGTGGLYDETEAGTSITYSGNVVTAPVATQMLSVAGKVQADIEIYQTGETAQKAVKLATFCFVVNVERAAFPDAKIISSDYYNIIAGDISEFRTAQEQILESQAALEQVAKSITGNVKSAQQAAQTATEKAAAAATAAQNAANSKAAAENAKTAAETAKADAESAKSAAAASATSANTSKEAAQSANAAAENAKTAAETAKEDAETAAEEAQNAASAMQECAPYSSTKSYVVANMVTNNGSTYRCIKPCTGIAPPNSTYWLVIAQKGADGLGSGDMLKDTYDPNGKAQDVFSYADIKAGNVQADLDAHKNSTGIHVTSTEKNTWDSKADTDDIPTRLSELSDDAAHRLVTDTEKIAWNGKANASDIPTSLSDLSSDATHRSVSDTEKNTWNNKADKAVSRSVTLYASSWNTSYKNYSVTVTGMTAAANCIITAAPASYMAYAEAGVRCISQYGNGLTFQCEEIPTADLAVNVLILG